jgi:hypothetical protein
MAGWRTINPETVCTCQELRPLVESDKSIVDRDEWTVALADASNIAHHVVGFEVAETQVSGEARARHSSLTRNPSGAGRCLLPTPR